MNNGDRRFITINEIAGYLEVSKQAVNTWIHSGQLKASRLPSGRIKILRNDFIDYLRANNLPVDSRALGGGAPTVVVVDDDPRIQQVIRTCFQEMGHPVDLCFAHDGVSGLLAIGKQLVVLDIEMPGMNGLEVVQKIGTDTHIPPPRVVIVSGYLERYQDALSGMPVERTIAKPFTPARFREAVEPIVLPLVN